MRAAIQCLVKDDTHRSTGRHALLHAVGYYVIFRVGFGAKLAVCSFEFLFMPQFGMMVEFH
jgi:hypothetical protein